MNGAYVCGATRSEAPDWMLPEDLVEGPDWLACCMGSVNDGPIACTCWRPVYDKRQRRPRTDVSPATRSKACADCAYRQGSPERERGDDLDGLPDRGATFYCHQGIRRPKAWRHPDGRVRPVPDLEASPDYQPPMLNQVPYKANGQPADRCGGWAAIARSQAVAS